MTCNIGGIDRNIRIISGVAFLLVGIFAQLGTALSIVFFALAGIAFATAFSGF